MDNFKDNSEVICKNNSYVNSTRSFQLYGCPWTTPKIIPIKIKLFDWKFVRNPIDMYNFILMVSMNMWGRVEENEQREHLVVLHTNIRKLMFLKQNQSLIK